MPNKTDGLIFYIFTAVMLFNNHLLAVLNFAKKTMPYSKYAENMR